jgi:hypothetical protein
MQGSSEERRYRVGRAGRETLESSLALPAGVRLREVLLGRRDVRLVLEQQGVASTFVLGATKPPRRSGGAAPTVELRVVEWWPRDDARQALADTVAEGLAGKHAEAWLAALRADALGWPATPRPERPQRLANFLRAPYWNDAWWRFLLPGGGIARQSVHLLGRHAYVHHASRECDAPGVVGPEVASTRFFSAEVRTAQRPVATAWTELDEHAVLTGGTGAALAQVVDELAGRGDLDFIDVQSTCVPDLLGDNATALARRVEAETGVRVNWNAKTRTEEDLYQRLLGERLARLLQGAAPAAGHVLLAGVSGGGRLEGELRALLALLGLTVTRTILPDVPLVTEPDPASALIWANPVGWEWFDDSLFLDHLLVVKEPPPFGLAGSLRWLKAVAAKLGVADAEPRLDEAAAAWQARVLPLRERCSAHRVALVGDRVDVRDLVARDGFFGFSVADLLAEMGFEVDALVHEVEGAEAGESWSPGGVLGSARFQRFSSRDELDGLLAHGPALVFTSFQHDPRLVAHALPGFAEDALEPGVEGFFRSAERLLARCRRRPFPGHRRFLTPCLGNVDGLQAP